MMRLIVAATLCVVLGGCGAREPEYQVGDIVKYDVNGLAGTGKVVNVQHRSEAGKLVLYYQVDVGVDGAGERDRPLLHEALLRPYSR